MQPSRSKINYFIKGLQGMVVWPLSLPDPPMDFHAQNRQRTPFDVKR